METALFWCEDIEFLLLFVQFLILISFILQSLTHFIIYIKYRLKKINFSLFSTEIEKDWHSLIKKKRINLFRFSYARVLHVQKEEDKIKKAPQQGIEPWFSDLKSDVLTIERLRRSNLNQPYFLKFLIYWSLFS